MSRLRTLATALVAVAAMTMCATPVLANPGNGNGNGNGNSGNHGNNGNKGNSGNSQKGNSGQKNNSPTEQRKIMVSRIMWIAT